MAVFSVEIYEMIKDYLQPNLQHFIDRYTENGIVRLPPFHGCGLQNKNGSQKLINYSNGDQCLTPSWTDNRLNLESEFFPFTRYMTQTKDRYLFKNKGNCVYNYSLKQYQRLLDTPMRESFKRFQEDKEKYLKSDTK